MQKKFENCHLKRYNQAVSNTKKVAASTAAQFIGKFIGIAISLVTVTVLFRFLGVEGVGKYTTAFAFVAFFSVFSDFGLGWTVLRELSVNDDKDKVFRNILTFKILVAFVVHASAIGIVYLFNYPQDVKVAVGVLSVSWFFQSVNSTVVSVFIQNFKLNISVSAEVAGRVLILVLIYLLSKTNASLGLVMATYFFGNLLNLLINLFFVRKYITLGLAYDKKYWIHVMRQAFPIGITIVFGYIYYKIDSIMLSVMKGMTDVGIYGTPYKLLEVLQNFPALFLGASFPLITRYLTQKDPRAESAFQKQFDFLIIMAVPIVILSFMLAGPIINFIAGSRGEEFLTASTVSLFGYTMTSVTCLRILIFSVGLSFVTNLYSFSIVSMGKQRKMVWPTIGLAAFNVLLNLALIPRMSYIGASFATLATEIILLTVVYKISHQNLKFSLNFNNFWKVIISGVVITLFCSLMIYFGLNFLLIIAASLIVYALLLILFETIPIDLLKLLTKKEVS